MSPGPVSFEPVTICAHWIGIGKLEVQAPIKTKTVLPKKDGALAQHGGSQNGNKGAKTLKDFT